MIDEPLMIARRSGELHNWTEQRRKKGYDVRLLEGVGAMLENYLALVERDQIYPKDVADGDPFVRLRSRVNLVVDEIEQKGGPAGYTEAALMRAARRVLRSLNPESSTLLFEPLRSVHDKAALIGLCEQLLACLMEFSNLSPAETDLFEMVEGFVEHIAGRDRG